MACPDPLPEHPGFIPVVDVAKMVLRYELWGGVIENVHYFTRTGGYTGTELDALNAAATTAWSATIRNKLPTEMTLETITSTNQEVAGGAQDIDLVGVTGANTTAAFETQGNTLCIKFGTALSGRNHRGRMYFPVLIATEVANGLVSASWAGQIRDAVEEFFGDILTDSGDQHVVVSYSTDCEWRTSGVATPVTSYSYTDRNLDSQRRRLAGRGI